MNLSRKQFAQFAQISLPVFGSERRDFSRKIYGPGRKRLEWSILDGRWAMVDGRWYMVEHLHPESPSVACAMCIIIEIWKLCGF